MTNAALSVRALHRVYTSRQTSPRVALESLDLEAGYGAIHGLLGPNGAGKTTLVRILSTVLLPTSGTAEVLGFDVVREPQEIRRRIGTVFGSERGLYSRVSVRRNLLFWSSLHGLDGRAARLRSDALMERVGITDRADVPVEQLSRGMVQRVHLARGLIGSPSLMFLDEPTTGLDPVAALAFRDLLRELLSEGCTFLLTTHDLAEAEALCERVSVIDKGRLLLTAEVRDVGRRLATVDRVDFTTADDGVADVVRASSLVRTMSPLATPGHFRVEPADEHALAPLLRLLVDRGVTSLTTTPPTLEEVYLQLVGDRGMTL